MNDSFIRFAGWSAYVNAVLSVAILVTIVAFFVLGGFWGTVNDVISVAWSLSFVPLLVALYLLDKDGNTSLSLATAVVGVVAALGFAFLQSLLVSGLVRFEQTFLMVVTLGAILGLAISFDGLLTRSSQTLPAGLTWLMIAFGLGYLLSAVGIWLGGQQHPLAAAGYLFSALTGPAWAIWLGTLLLNGRLLAIAQNPSS